MIFANTFSLVLALAPATLFAAPTTVTESIAGLIPRQDLPKPVVDELRKTNGLCDLSNVVLPVGTFPSSSTFPHFIILICFAAPTPLPSVGEGHTLRHIAIGRGIQNYTCASADAAPVAIGAVATLFNATCDSARLNERVMTDITTLALNYVIPTGPEADQRLSGHHYFTDKKVPMFDLRTEGSNYGYVQATPDVVKSAAPQDASAGPNQMGSVAWLKLNAVEGDYKEVYRVHTAGGAPPKTCDGMGSAFSVEYSAQYWFYA